MTGAATQESVDVDISVLESLDFDITPKCDNDACDNDATHLIHCPCGKGTEFSCMTCIQKMQQGAEVNPAFGVIQFDPNKSCGHGTLITDCTISPL